MYIQINKINGVDIAEVVSQEIVLRTVQDAVDILGDCSYGNVSRVIINENNIHPSFFDLKTGLAGEILQKFSNYRVRLAIVGDFSKYTSKSLQDFIYESNKNKHINFLSSLYEAQTALSK